MYNFRLIRMIKIPLLSPHRNEVNGYVMQIVRLPWYSDIVLLLERTSIHLV